MYREFSMLMTEGDHNQTFSQVKEKYHMGLWNIKKPTQNSTCYKL